jgi:hypothetical protein
MPEVFWVDGKQQISLWIPGNASPYLSRHLIDPVRACIGFWAHDLIPIEDKAEMSGLLPGEFIAMNRMLLESDIGAVRFCKQYGLPPSASVRLRKAFRCKKCRGSIISLPCIQCWKGPDDDPHV